MKTRLFTISGLVLFCVVVFLPPIMHHYVYPNLGDDTAGYLAIFDSMQRGIIRPNVQYVGYAIVGYPLVLISSLSKTSVDVLFLWFNYAALAGVGLTMYFVASRLINRIAGWVSLLVVLFCAQSIFFQFYYGQIFNLINIGIILPWLLYFTAKHISDRGRRNLILVLFFALLYGSFHTSGIYLLAIGGVAFVVYLAYSMVKRRSMERRIVYMVVGVLSVGVVGFGVFVFAPTLEMMSAYYEDYLGAVLIGMRNAMGVPLGNYLMDIVSPSVLILLSLLAVHYKETIRSLDAKAVKIVLFLLAGGILALVLVTFAKLTPDPWRQALDLASIFAVFIALSVGLLLKYQRTKLIIAVLVLSIGFGLFHNLPTWFGYTSVMRTADKAAMEYINHKGYKNYSCSSEVAHWVYYRFIDVEWVKEGGELYIARSKPMTPRSDANNMWYQEHGIDLPSGYSLVATYRDDEVSVWLYER